MDELLDLVNENDEVIGEVWRSETNNDVTKIHREIGVLIYDDDRKVLLQQRSMSKVKCPGMWTVSCAGHITKGNTPEESATIEMLEELGLKLKLNFVRKYLDEITGEKRFVYLYLAKYNGEEITFQKSEIQQVKFVSRDEFEEMEKMGMIRQSSADWCREFWGTK